MKHYRRALTIAGSDSGGGAGIQADLKTFSALECYGMSVITALTAQNTCAVTAVQPVPADFVAAQIRAVVEDIGVDAIKIGMLNSPAVITSVAAELRQCGCQRIVLDPVMVAKSGDKLLQDDAVAALQSELLPLATLITPNLPEAEVLLGRPLKRVADFPAAAVELLNSGPQAVLIKGGHLGQAEDSVDYLRLATGGEAWLRAPRIESPNTHGTGCTLSSAIAALLARGSELETAVRGAKQYLTEALEAGRDYRIGRGHGPVKHFYRWWAQEEAS